MFNSKADPLMEAHTRKPERSHRQDREILDLRSAYFNATFLGDRPPRQVRTGRKKRLTKHQRKGLLFEEHVTLVLDCLRDRETELSESVPALAQANPWIYYRLEDEDHFRCISPDYLWMPGPGPREGEGHIFEVKLTHTLTAYEQIQYMYYPVLKALFPKIKYWFAYEVVHWDDQDITFPVETSFEYLMDGETGWELWGGGGDGLMLPRVYKWHAGGIHPPH